MITIDCTFDLHIFYADLFTDKIGNDIIKNYFIFYLQNKLLTGIYESLRDSAEVHKAGYLRSE